MRRVILLPLLLLGFQLLAMGSVHAECPVKSNPEIEKLLDDKEFDKAQQFAQKMIDADPAAMDGHVWLSRTYWSRAVNSGISIDTLALGLGPGESGTVEIPKDQEKFNEAFKPSYFIEPGAGAKIEEEINYLIATWPDQKCFYADLLNLYAVWNKDEQYRATLKRAGNHFKSDSDYLQSLLSIVNDYFKEKGPELTGKAYLALLDVWPDAPELLSSYGAATLMSGDLDTAIAYFERAYKKSPKDSIILGNLGEAYIYAQDFEKSEQFIELFLKEQPAASSRRFDLAMVKLVTGVEPSLKAWKRYFRELERYPDDPQWENTAKSIRHGLQNSPDENWLAWLAGEFLNAKVVKYAIPIIAYLQKKNPREPEYLYMMAYAYDIERFFSRVEGELQRFLKLTEGNNSGEHPIAEIYFNLARSVEAQGRLQDALKHYQKVHALDPKYPSIHYALGRMYAQLDQKMKAKEEFQACIDKPETEKYPAYCKQNLKNLKAGE